MILSELIRKFFPHEEYEMHNEREFQTMGLVGSFTGSKEKLTFIDTETYINDIADDVSMIITNKTIANKIKLESFGICIVQNPRLIYFKLHNHLSNDKAYIRQRFKSRIGANSHIHPSVVIPEENVVIGDNCIIEEYVVIRENVEIGDNCIIRAGVKIGLPDFEFKNDKDGLFAVIHCGGVIIGNDVEILSNTGINCALYPWDDTVIGDHCKIDMLCNISHGAKIGRNTMIVALSGVGGRTEIGENCWIGYGAILRNGITIGNNSRVNMGAIVTKNVDDNQAVSGNFAIDHDLFMNELKAKSKRKIYGKN
ncbi:MAG: DapH/DapD/GlmU-related protein [Clostridiales bacterium]|nr:DapH/DapD/GlmU-related protein [Clostridiales bacterium]MDY4061142.1 UDP-3-O-(3-hydroxymyristoyl)glucosamine N-acyltransferase [Anaerovoracaceae bacterium]